MKKISLKNLKSEIQKTGNSKGKFLYFKANSKARVRFLTDLEDGFEVTFHDSFSLGVNVPCQEQFGRDCPYCDDEDLRTRNMYVWSVYDYESGEVKLLMQATNQCSAVPALASLYESYGTLCDRDYEIKRIGEKQNTSYSVIPLDKSPFKNKKAKALSEEAILKFIDKAYPNDNSEDIGEEEERPKNKGTSKKAKTKQDENEWEDETEQDYENMSAKDLYKLCKEKEIDCKPKKSKEYYLDLLEEFEEEQDEDEWDDEEDDDWE